jgi:CheY-like chemotaxis protein
MPGKRILIVDDENDIREVAQVSLELVGDFEVIAAASGPEGVESARSRPPDAILLDVSMPGMDGPATLAALHADPSTRAIPVVFLTARTQSAERASLMELGVAGLITKPFDPLKLAGQLSAALGWD